MNYMSEVAKMLEVELGEEFEIVFPNSNCHATALLNSERLYIKKHNVANQDMWQAYALTHILNGSYTIKRKPWKPEKRERYYFVANDGNILSDTNDDATVDFLLFKVGNCYRTKEDAESNLDKWIGFYASDEVLEV